MFTIRNDLHSNIISLHKCSNNLVAWPCAGSQKCEGHVLMYPSQLILWRGTYYPLDYWTLVILVLDSKWQCNYCWGVLYLTRQLPENKTISVVHLLYGKNSSVNPLQLIMEMENELWATLCLAILLISNQGFQNAFPRLKF